MKNIIVFVPVGKNTPYRQAKSTIKKFAKNFPVVIADANITYLPHFTDEGYVEIRELSDSYVFQPYTYTQPTNFTTQPPVTITTSNG